MTRRRSALLIFNAALVLLASCFVGVPYGEARKEQTGQDTWFNVPGTATQWELAHLEGLLNSTLAIALAAVLIRLPMSRRSETVIFWSFVALPWGNAVGGVLAALGDDDSFSTDLVKHNPIAMLFYGAAALGAFVGFAETARCAWREAQRAGLRSEEPASVA
jgi:hypothetical protein